MTKGQILENSIFGQNIMNIIEKYSPLNIVEIGTWKGLGSTKRVIDSLIKNNLKSNFISIETNPIFYNEAKINLQLYEKYVKLFLGRIVEIEEVIRFCKFVHEQVNLNWLMQDLYNMIETPNIFNLLPEKIDFLILDGGEYSTYAEWKKLKDRTTIVAIDDIVETKTKIINEELSKDNNYDLIITSGERNGFSIYKKNI
jgi:hypothetical protein